MKRVNAHWAAARKWFANDVRDMTEDERRRTAAKSQRKEAQSVTEGLWTGLALVAVALILFNTGWWPVGFLLVAGAIFQFVVAAIAQGVKEGRGEE